MSAVDRDWRLLFRPGLRWQPCPQCTGASGTRERLHDRLLQMLAQRIRKHVGSWRRRGEWWRADLPDEQWVYCWRDLLVLSPGSLQGGFGWTLMSRRSLATHLSRQRLASLLKRSGAPKILD